MQSTPQLESLFYSALEKGSAEELAAFLEEACGDDTALRNRLELMLEVQGEDFLQAPPSEIREIAADSICESVGTQIGPYKLLEQIGEGGFGVVYRADQSEPVRRQVALKIIKPGMDTKDVIARFEAERQALAMMDHPSIAKVFDAGATDLGRPYFAMELVKGIPITEYCDQANLPTRERLELFKAVCQAVQHAHQKGIIHRDIKPTNVLVAMQDGQALPKIIDFGVAKAINQRLTQHTLVTAFAQMVGTPLYMSPEQAEMSPLEVDTRSDIYSLGVLLYELLTGTTPFQKERMKSASFDELRRIIREEEPPKPSSRLSTLDAAMLSTVAEHRRLEPRKLRQTVEGELDWIVIKCLEKDSSRRYESANGLARDVARYLADEPVEAWPPSFGYRLSKFVKRNHKLVFATTALLLMFIFVIASVGWALRDRAMQLETIETEVDAALVDVEQLLEAGRPHEALAAARRAQAIAGRWSISSSLNSTASQWQRDVKLVLDLEEIRTSAKVLALEEIPTSADWNPTNRSSERLDLLPRYRAAFEQNDMGLIYDDNEQLIRRIRQRPPSVKRVILNALSEMVDLFRRQTQIGIRLAETDPLIMFIDPAGPAAASGLKAGDFVIAVGDPNDDSVKDVSTSEEALQLIAGKKSSNVLVRVASNSSGAEQSFVLQRDPSWRDMLAILNQVDDDPWRRDFWDAVDRGDRGKMLTLALHDDFLTQTPTDICMVVSHIDTPIAIKILRKALQLNPDSFWINSALGDRIRELEPPARNEAIEYYRAALSQRPASPGMKFNLGTALQNADRHKEAVELLREVIKELPQFSNAHNNLANALCDLRYFDEALAHYQKAMSLKPENWLYHYNVGVLWQKQLQWAAAIKSLQRAIQLLPGNLQETAHMYRAIGHDSRYSGLPEEGITAYREALARKPDWTEAIDGIGKCQICLGNPAEALVLFRKSSQIENKSSTRIQILSYAHLLEEKSDPIAKFYAQLLNTNKEDWIGVWTFLTQEDQLFRRILEMMPNDPRPWSARARAHEAAQQWDLAAADWAKVIELRHDSDEWGSPRVRLCRDLAGKLEIFEELTKVLPEERALWIGAGQYHAVRNQWKLASDYYSRSIRQTRMGDHVFSYAGCLLLAGEGGSYQELCNELYRLDVQPHLAYTFNIARTCLLGPATNVPLKRCVELATQSLEMSDKPWTQHLMGLAYYHSGDFQKALADLERSNDGTWSDLSKAQNSLVLAMIYHDQSKTEQAQWRLRQAQELIDQARPQSTGDPPPTDWISLQVLRRQAEAKIGPMNQAANEH